MLGGRLAWTSEKFVPAVCAVQTASANVQLDMRRCEVCLSKGHRILGAESANLAYHTEALLYGANLGES